MPQSLLGLETGRNKLAEFWFVGRHKRGCPVAACMPETTNQCTSYPVPYASLCHFMKPPPADLHPSRIGKEVLPQPRRRKRAYVRERVASVPGDPLERRRIGSNPDRHCERSEAIQGT
jgi:hypothetical protein